MTRSSEAKVAYAAAGGGCQAISLLIPLAPRPASRPRVTRWGTYYGKLYKQWMADASRLIPEAEVTVTSPCAVNIWLTCKRPQKVTRQLPVGDIDNYAKAVLDALTKKGFWTDDDLIEQLTINKEYAKPGEEPRIRVSIYHKP